ncbi:MAG TPA: ATP-dependent acyl-CoA ligase [Candidatus Thalassarchaeaceae archaeon]|nr:MAG TPA: ATP-dependent acyl-CoA ligase [Candidatus Poseidoniales archaeon]HIH80035.1 ATP-dependent acyl-CoA ligase [Candidatus Thalassarchaeaceae archaeon]|tara:strand:- start:1096 stop:2733 length:1638 start_codon:yes stop_codon:yes gene_type:complete
MKTEWLSKQMWEHGSIRGLAENRATTEPDKIFLIFHGRSLSYGEFDLLANQAGNMLIGLGVKRDDKVAIMMKNCVEWVTVWFGAAKIGAIVCPVNTAYVGEGLAYQLDHSDSSLLIIDEEYSDRFFNIEKSVPKVQQIVVRQTGEGQQGMGTQTRDLSTELANNSTHPPPECVLAPGDPASILYTSGTTGRPKGCVLPQGQYLVAAEQMVLNCEYRSDDILYTCLPLFHINAQNYSVLAAMAASATIVLDDKFTASGFWNKLIDNNVTAFNFIGGMPLMLWNQEPTTIDNAHKARLAFGVPVPLEIWNEWEERFDLRIVYAYGMTENALPTLFPISDTPAIESLRGSGGKESDSAEVAIFDESGQNVQPGNRGEVVTRPKIPWTMMLEYYQDSDATQEAIRNGWFHTGDLGYLDEEGYFFYLDRQKDAFRRRGEMISSWQVESVVQKFPGVLECAAVAVPSEVGEDEILVAVVRESDSHWTEKELQSFCTENMAYFQVPRYIRIVEQMPKTQTERIEKFRLRNEGVTEDTWDGETPSLSVSLENT